MLPYFKEAPISQIPALRFLQQLGFSCLNPEKVAVKDIELMWRALLGNVLGSQLRWQSLFPFKERKWDFIEFLFPLVAILDAAIQELTLLLTQRQTLDQQKCGLMRHLLTGGIRIINI